MSDDLWERIVRAVDVASGQYHRLVLLVGPPGSGKTTALEDVARARGWPLLNVNLQLSERLLELSSKQRAVRVPKLLSAIVREAGADVVLLDNLELLFSTELAHDPLRLLQGLARNRTIVATWTGAVVDGRLTYAEPGHPEARSYHDPGAVIVPADASHPRRGSRVAGRGPEEAW